MQIANGAARSDVHYLSAAQALRGFAAGTLSPVTVVEAALARIAALDDTLNAFCHVDADAALNEARASERRWAEERPKGALDGLPASVKDLWDVSGMPTRKGSLLTADRPARTDAPAVARLREQGAIVLGKTTTCEFGWKGVTDSPGFGISRNPWDPTKTSGGSSGGAAIAAAAGMGILHLASDGGGSIRIPSSFCGVFGFKSTWGRVAAGPSGPLPMVSHSGPITRTVADARLMLEVIAKPDATDWQSLPQTDFLARSRFDGSLAGLRIGYSRDLGYALNLDPEVSELVDAAARHLSHLGADVVEVPPPFDMPREFARHIYSTGFATILAGFEDRIDVVDPGLVAWAAHGRHTSGIDVLQAWALRDLLGRQMNEFHRQYDLLLTPQMPIPAFEAGINRPALPGVTIGFDWNPYAYPFNLTGQPAAAVPCGFTEVGLPVAFQLVGPRYDEATILRVAEAYESERPFLMPSEILRR